MDRHTLSRPGQFDPQQRAYTWRKRAEELRTIAESLQNSTAYESLVRQAEQWERMAEQVETLARSGPPSLEDSTLLAFLNATHADLGDLQALQRPGNALEIIAHRGFDRAFLQTFKVVTAESPCACGRALKIQKRVFIPDIDKDPDIAPHRAALHAAGVRAILSVPIKRAGIGVVGILSAHFAVPTQLSAPAIAAAEAQAAIAGEVLRERFRSYC